MCQRAVLSSPYLEGKTSAPSSSPCDVVEALLSLLVSTLLPIPTPTRCRRRSSCVCCILPVGAEAGRGNNRDGPGPDAAGTPTKATTPSASVMSNAPSNAAPRRVIFASLEGIFRACCCVFSAFLQSSRCSPPPDMVPGTVRPKRKLAASHTCRLTQEGTQNRTPLFLCALLVSAVGGTSAAKP